MDIWPDLLLHSHGKLCYSDGVKIFLRMNSEARWKDFFKVEDRYSRKKLKAFLDAKYAEMQKNRETGAFRSFGHSKLRGKINVEILPAELRQEYGNLSPVIREMSQKHAQLFKCRTDDERLELARKIIGLSDARRRILDRIDSYIATGQDLQQPKIPTDRKRPEVTIDPAVQVELQRLRVQRSKLKNNPRRVIEFNEICQQISQLEKARYIVSTSNEDPAV